MTTGTGLRAEGQGAVLAADTAPHRGYADYVDEAVQALMDKGMEFTAEDVRLLIPEGVRAHHPNVLPAVLGGMAANGRIVAIGHRQCRRTSRRAGWMRVWTAAPRTGPAG